MTSECRGGAGTRQYLPEELKILSGKHSLCTNSSPKTAALWVTGTLEGLMDFIFPIFDMHLSRDFSENTSSDVSGVEDLEEVERATTAALLLKHFRARIF